MSYLFKSLITKHDPYLIKLRNEPLVLKDSLQLRNDTKPQPSKDFSRLQNDIEPRNELII